MGELGVLIPILIFSLPIIAIWTSHQQKMARLKLDEKPAIDPQQANHAQELEDRVRVLERIITDKGYDVATQIEALRETRKVDALLDGRSDI